MIPSATTNLSSSTRGSKTLATSLGLAAAVVTFLVSGCDWMPGKPKPSDQWVAPDKELDFHHLFAANCLGCHGDGKIISPVISLADPVYLAVLPQETLQDIIANGVPKTAMPAFAQAHGGLLTDEQIDILAKGIRDWAQNPPAGPLPPYAAPSGDAAAREALYLAYRDAIGKAAGPGVVASDFLANRVFLGLTSDQYLRTLIIAGRPELGIPDWRSAIPGRPLTDQDIADIVAWLISQRKNEFGQPLVPAPTPVEPQP